ncbi:phosphotransferase family protein [Flavobacterium lindanitolerans]|uniref:phosphotransferase family protein n=1 Tax=Flavobacterium lindanitolerans TaxID=428988 RepID=UPI0031DFCE37
MQLIPENVYHYLHKRQLIDEEAVVRGHFMVHPVKTRNTILKVIVEPHNSLFVKQTGNDAVSKSLFLREINAYDLFKNSQTFSAVAPVTSHLLDHDDENNVMVFELLHNAKNLTEYYMLTKNFDLHLAREQASILALCHIRPKAETDTSLFPKLLPWVLQLDRHTADAFFANNEASAAAIQLIKDNPLLLNALSQLGATWQYTHLIHGDIKWINFLAIENENGISQRLIDWELADIGDPMWDVAGLLQSYVATWLLGFDNNNPFSNKLPEHMKFYDLKNMQPSAQAFIYQYIEEKSIPESDHPAFFTRLMQFTAARILQTSIEGITFNTKIEANNMRCIQLAFNIMENPLAALEELFDIKLYQYV